MGSDGLSGHVSLLCPSLLQMPQLRAFFDGLLVLGILEGFGHLFLLCPFSPQFEHVCFFRFSLAEGVLDFFGLPDCFLFNHGNTMRSRTASGMSHVSGVGTGLTGMA